MKQARPDPCDWAIDGYCLSGGSLVNAGDAVVPTQIDGDNHVTHRKPPVNEGEEPSR
jgi:hypothetical protein